MASGSLDAQKIKKRDDAKNVRLYDIINRSFFASFPNYPYDPVIANRGNRKWQNLMEFLPKADYKKKYEPQWKMRQLDDMITKPVAYGTDATTSTVKDGDADNLIDNLLKCALMTKMAMEGTVTIQGESNHGETASYLDHQYSRWPLSADGKTSRSLTYSFYDDNHTTITRTYSGENHKPFMNVGDPYSAAGYAALGPKQEYLGNSDKVPTPFNYGQKSAHVSGQKNQEFTRFIPGLVPDYKPLAVK